jgi:hypothetical protein
MSLDIATFSSNFKRGGVRANLFKVWIPKLGDTEFFVKASGMPGSMIGQAIANYQGRELKLAGNRIFDDWNVTLYLDPSYAIKNSLEEWMNDINGHKDNMGVTSINDYLSTAHVEQYDRDGSLLKSYDMVGIWPSSAAEVVLDWSDNDNIATMDVTFTVAEYWSSPNTTR